MASPLSDPDIRHHERFYFSDGGLYLLVERTLYRVHRSLFEIHASKFPAHGLDTSGSETCFLKDVKRVDFDRLLACLYPRALLVEEAESTEEWVSILRLASKWGFETLQSRAISKIEHTLTSPVDMVVLGRQYNIPNILLLGYATLCQGTTPLSSEEGRRLGVEDVVNIYRIRHELYGSAIAPVSFEEALEKVRISLLNEEQEDEKDLEVERADPDLDDEQSSEWTDAGSVAASPKSVAEEVVSLTADTHAGTDTSDSDGDAIGSSYADPASQTSSAEKDKETVDLGSNTSAGLERPEDQPGPVSEQERTDVNTVFLPSETPLDAPLSAERPEAQGDPESEKERFEEPLPGGEATPDASSSRSGGIPTITPSGAHVPDSSGSAGQVFQFLDELTTKNFDLVTKNILGWFKVTPNSQTLYRFTRLIVERAVAEQTGQFNILVRLCKEMMNHLSGKVKIKKRSGGLVFRDYLGDICRENLKGIGASTIVAGGHTAEFRRLRLIEFIGNLAKQKGVAMWTPDIIDKWVTALLDDNDEEQFATLCMLLTRPGPLCTEKKKKLRTHIKRWSQEMSKFAQRTSKPRVRALLQNVISRQDLGWF